MEATAPIPKGEDVLLSYGDGLLPNAQLLQVCVETTFPVWSHGTCV